jgi:alkylation response protein AidB-like acyl-CoA dehydrogenase
MNFQFSEEQQLLADSVLRLIDEQYDFEARKKIIASDEGWSPLIYAKLSELGLTALPFAESLGGFGAGALDMVPVMQALGKGLLLEPLATTLAVPAALLAHFAETDSSQRLKDLIAQVIEGQVRVAWAHDEVKSRWDLATVQSTASQEANGQWHLRGEKRVVLHAPAAQCFILSARTAGGASDRKGISLFLVPADTAGLHQKTYRTYDDQRAADLIFDLRLEAGALLGNSGEAFDAIEAACDWAQALLCAEALGVMDEANRLTLEYLKTRKQFGMPIGSFQSLQHRMVDMMMSAEQSRSITYLACDRVDAYRAGRVTANERSKAVAMARVKVNEAARHIGQEAIQLHGGMGMTIEMKVSHSFKRLTAISQQFGDLDHQLDRLANAA